MNLATLSLDGPGGTLLLLAYAFGGLVLVGTSMLRGNSTGWRIFGAFAGIGLTLWSGYVLIFNGFIIISYYVLLLPYILAFRAIATAVKSRRQPTSQLPPPQGFMPQPGQPAGAPPYGYAGQPGYPYPQGQQAFPGQPYPQQAPGPQHNSQYNPPAPPQ